MSSYQNLRPFFSATRKIYILFFCLFFFKNGHPDIDAIAPERIVYILEMFKFINYNFQQNTNINNNNNNN